MSMQAAQERWAISTKSEPVTTGLVAYSDAPILRAPRLSRAVASTVAVFTFAITGIGTTPSEAATLALYKWSSDSSPALAKKQSLRETVEQAVRAFLAYPPGWDGQDAAMPSNKVVDDAIAFLRMLPLTTASPRPGLSNDGELSLFWQKNGVYIDVGFTGDGMYSYYAKDAAEREYFGDDLPLDDPNLLLDDPVRQDLLAVIPRQNS